MKPKKLSNTFRNSEHGEKAEPLVKGGQEIKMKGVLEEQESYYLQSSHLFKFDGADLEKPEAPFRASKQVMEKLQKDQATRDWFADRPGFGGDPNNTPIPEWYQQLMSLLGPWMAGGGQMMFFHTNASYSEADHTFESGDFHGFHSEMWRIQREAREFVIQQLFDFDQDGVSLGMDPEVQDYIYNYLIDQNPANSWITPDMITPFNLHGIGHYYSQTNPNYTGDLELRWIGPDGQQVLSSSGGVLGPTGWISQFMNNGPGAEYALANEWQWPPSIDPFGLWQALAEGAPMPPDPFNAMISASQFLAQMVTYQDGTSNPEEFPEIDFDVDYEAAGYESLLDYYTNTSSLYAQNPIMLYYQYIAGGGEGYSHYAGASFFYPHYLQQLLQTLGIDIDPSINTDYSGYATGNIDDFFTGPGMEEYQALLDLMSLHHNETGDSDQGMASMLQAYMSSNGDYGWNAQLGAYMDWYATGVQGGFIELSEAGYDTFEAAYTAYTGDQDNPFNWFWFDFSQEIGSDEFLNIYEYTLSPDGYSPDWGQTFGDDSGYNEGGWYGESYYDFDPQADLNFITTAEQYLDTFPPGNFTGSEGVPLWYQTIMSAYTGWAANGLSTNFGFSGTAADFIQNNQPGSAEQGGGHASTAGNYFHQYTNYWVNLAFDHDGDGQFNENALLDLADQGFNFGQMVINSINYQLAQEGLGPTTLTVADLTPEMFIPTSPPAGTINPVTGEEISGWWWGHGAFYEADPQLYNLNRSELMSWANGHPNYASGGGEPHPYPGGIASTPWHADFILTGPTGVFPPELDPLGIWEFNTNGEGPGFGLQMSANLAQSYYFYLATTAAIQSFQMFGNVFQTGSIATNGNVQDLWAGNTGGQMDPEDAAHTTGSIVTWTFFHSVNYLAGADGLDEAGNVSTYGGVFQELVDALQVNNYNEETGLANYDPPDNNSWMFNLLYQYFHLQPGNPIMEESFFAEQEELFSWYLLGVVGMGDMEDISTWNGPLASEMSEEAINNFNNALEAGTVFFDFTYGVTDPNFVYYTTQGEDGNPIWMQFGTAFMQDILGGPTINPSIGMGTMLGNDAILNMADVLNRHGGMIDYNGDGRVDVGDFLAFLQWALFDAGAAEDYNPLIQFAGIFGLLIPANEGFAGPLYSNWFNQLAAGDNVGAHAWLLPNINGYGDELTFSGDGTLGAGVFGFESDFSFGGMHLGAILAPMLMFQFVNEFVESGGNVPTWYEGIVNNDYANANFDDFLNIIYPEWSTWSTSNEGLSFSGPLATEAFSGESYDSINTFLLAVLPGAAAMSNYAAYYLQNGININEQFVVSAGNILNVSAGGDSLSDGLDSQLAQNAITGYVTSLVSQNASLFASFDVLQDGSFGQDDQNAIATIMAILSMSFQIPDLWTEDTNSFDVFDIISEILSNPSYMSLTLGVNNAISAFGVNPADVGIGPDSTLLDLITSLGNQAGIVIAGSDSASLLAPYVNSIWGAMFQAMLGWESSGEFSWEQGSGADMPPLAYMYNVMSGGSATTSSNYSNYGILAEFQELIQSLYLNDNSVFGNLFENTDGSYYTDADGNQIPFSFTAAGLQALAGATYGAQAGSGASLYQTEEWNEAYQDIAQALGEAGVDIDFNGDGVYDMNDINILLSIAENGPVTEAQVQLAEILNYQSGSNSVEFGLDDVIMFMNFFGNPGPTTVYGYEGSSYTWIDNDGNQTVYNMDSETGYQGMPIGTNINMFGYFNDDGTWVDFGYDDVTPDDYFGPGWSATQTNNNETTS